MDVLLGNGRYNQIEREIYQMTGFSNMLDMEDNSDSTSARGSFSQENEVRHMSENRNNISFPSDVDTLIGEINSRISQDIGSLLNDVS